MFYPFTSIGQVIGWILTISGSNIRSPTYATFNHTRDSHQIDVFASNLAYLLVPGGAIHSVTAMPITLSIMFQQFSILMAPVPILESTIPANIITSSTHHVSAIFNAIPDVRIVPFVAYLGLKKHLVL
jgi:hypothetical protein